MGYQALEKKPADYYNRTRSEIYVPLPRHCQNFYATGPMERSLNGVHKSDLYPQHLQIKPKKPRTIGDATLSANDCLMKKVILDQFNLPLKEK